MQNIVTALVALLLLCGCGTKGSAASGDDASKEAAPAASVKFDADSAYSYVERQVAFGPRVPGTEAHRQAGAWLSSELRRHGASVTEQRATLTAFDGTRLPAVNIFGQFNPRAEGRVLLLAHWDCRPWADADPDEANRKTPVDGANDGASGVGVLLEIARQIKASGTGKGIDILFVDAEDWGSHDVDDSWALGARHFVENLPEGYSPAKVVLLDMVGGENARFNYEYFSVQAAPDLCREIWGTAHSLGHGDRFPMTVGGAVTDDHVQFIEHGIPAVDIIEFNPSSESGFNSRWHTVSDNMEGISRETLGIVGETVGGWLLRQ